ncbi:flagellar protein FlgN [Teredinibacter sp. KSP-S5-2]|uniref:flagella synthesis protein FlgN n=1 Tax=Teredinibacter sp. KSP-S5-2 TaxID=3034506 RepID=UPI0029351CF5|nr:flagellar protein FlgN [Teredinibacter sp. KSP-S5-2]WNO07988.1 flagellar protein FlgN [Teredinibacter sp. KSP-S5-2]
MTLANTQTSSPNQQDIEQQVATDINACKQLLRLLTDESEALKHRDANKLEEIINSKLAYLAQLEQSANLRSQWLKVPIEQAADKWDELLLSFQNPGLQAAWKNLQKLVEECRVKNETNGKMLARNQQVYSRLVNIVRGQTDAPSLYTATGNATGGYNRGNSVGEA